MRNCIWADVGSLRSTVDLFPTAHCCWSNHDQWSRRSRPQGCGPRLSATPDDDAFSVPRTLFASATYPVILLRWFAFQCHHYIPPCTEFTFSPWRCLVNETLDLGNWNFILIFRRQKTTVNTHTTKTPTSAYPNNDGSHHHEQDAQHSHTMTTTKYTRTYTVVNTDAYKAWRGNDLVCDTTLSQRRLQHQQLKRPYAVPLLSDDTNYALNKLSTHKRRDTTTKKGVIFQQSRLQLNRTFWVRLYTLLVDAVEACGNLRPPLFCGPVGCVTLGYLCALHIWAAEQQSLCFLCIRVHSR